MRFPAFQITEKNNRLLFNYAASNLSKEESDQVKKLIESDENWRDYYHDMKTLYEEYGEEGLEVNMERDSLSSFINQSNWSHTLLTYKGQILDLIREYRNTSPGKRNPKSILVDLIDIGESLANIPDFELINLSNEYDNTMRYLIGFINEILEAYDPDIQYQIEPDLQKIERLMNLKQSCFISFECSGFPELWQDIKPATDEDDEDEVSAARTEAEFIVN